MAQQLSPEEKNELLDRVENRASAYYYEFSGCGQMVLLALQQEFKFPNSAGAFKAATFSGQATSGLGGTCGALAGAILAIGLASGRERIEDSIFPEPDLYDESTGFIKSRQVLRNFYDRFKEEFGTLGCQELQLKLIGRSYDPAISEDMVQYREDNGREACSSIAGKAARLAAETILEMPRR
jgi:C_GCAxxG_C_C family probable redox protein